MSVNGTLVRITDEDLEWLRSHDADEDGEGDVTDGWFWNDNPRAFEMHKAYAAIHFCLTGEDHGGEGELSFIANEAVGEALRYEFAYGPGRALAPSLVRSISAALDALPKPLVEARLNSDTIAEVYPFSLRGGLDDDDRDGIMGTLEDLQRFVREAADAGTWLLVATL